MATIFDGDSTTLTFIGLHGEINVLGERLVNITRAGLDGHSFRKVGKTAEPFTLRGVVDLDTGADRVKATMVIYKTFTGKLCTITDDLAEAHTNMMCLGVRLIRSVKPAAAVGGVSTSKAYLVTVDFRFQATEVPA